MLLSECCPENVFRTAPAGAIIDLINQELVELKTLTPKDPTHETPG